MTTPTCKPCAIEGTAARPLPSNKEGDGMASALTIEDATLTDGLEQEPTQLDRIESMLVWLCVAMEGEQEEEATASGMTLDGRRWSAPARPGGTL